MNDFNKRVSGATEFLQDEMNNGNMSKEDLKLILNDAEQDEEFALMKAIENILNEK